MARRGLGGFRSAARLRWLLGLMFLGLAIPAALLVRQGFARLELEEFRRQQLIAESLVRRIDSTLAAAVAVENARPASDFQFAVAAPAGGAAQLSPLSSISPVGAFPGAIGYFQVDAAGELTTPLLPQSEGERRSLEQEQVQMKVAVERRVAEVLGANRLVNDAASPLQPTDADGGRSAAPAAGAAAFALDDAVTSTELRGQRAFDQLTESPAPQRVPAGAEAGGGDSAAEAGSGGDSAAEAGSGGDSAAEAGGGDSAAEAAAGTRAEGTLTFHVASFAGEIEPLRFSPLETGQLVLFRNAWREGERYVQGLLIDRDALLRDHFAVPFRQAGFPDGARLRISVAGAAVSTLGVPAASETVEGSALYTARLSPPLSDIELDFTAGRLDRGPGFGLLVWTAIALAAVLAGGFVTMYLFGMQQLKLAREQRNFVSAVSHELKTPLTSIRLYGEMLKSGWADDEKKKVYYDFIVGEGERLSRLIENVLQLARLNNGGPAVEPEAVTVGELFDLLRSKLVTQAERAGFTLELDVAPDARELGISVDADALTQIFINLVDNAIKFSGEAKKQVVLAARRRDASHVLLTVRDFGPGIPPAALKRLFELFYRPDDELTRATSGTGIGLALVRQLVTAMNGRIDVRNCEPGAEFRLLFPLVARDVAG